MELYLPALLGQLLVRLRAAFRKHHGVAQFSSKSCSANSLGWQSCGLEGGTLVTKAYQLK